MKVTKTSIHGLLVLQPEVHYDTRGLFIESWQRRDFDAAIGRSVRFVQDNHSRSVRGVLRGLHFQRPPHALGRLVRVVHGRVFDVAVDLRRGSPSFGLWHGIELDGDELRMVWLPPGLAHGFLVLSESADFLYKTTGLRVPEAERCIRWDDPALGIAWPDMGHAPLLSPRDAAAPTMAEAVAL